MVVTTHQQEHSLASESHGWWGGSGGKEGGGAGADHGGVPPDGEDEEVAAEAPSVWSRVSGWLTAASDWVQAEIANSALPSADSRNKYLELTTENLRSEDLRIGPVEINGEPLTNNFSWTLSDTYDTNGVLALVPSKAVEENGNPALAQSQNLLTDNTKYESFLRILHGDIDAWQFKGRYAGWDETKQKWDKDMSAEGTEKLIVMRVKEEKDVEKCIDNLRRSTTATGSGSKSSENLCGAPFVMEYGRGKPRDQYRVSFYQKHPEKELIYPLGEIYLSESRTAFPQFLFNKISFQNSIETGLPGVVKLQKALDEAAPEVVNPPVSSSFRDKASKAAKKAKDAAGKAAGALSSMTSSRRSSKKKEKSKSKASFVEVGEEVLAQDQNIKQAVAEIEPNSFVELVSPTSTAGTKMDDFFATSGGVARPGVVLPEAAQENNAVEQQDPDEGSSTSSVKMPASFAATSASSTASSSAPRKTNLRQRGHKARRLSATRPTTSTISPSDYAGTASSGLSTAGTTTSGELVSSYQQQEQLDDLRHFLPLLLFVLVLIAVWKVFLAYRIRNASAAAAERDRQLLQRERPTSKGEVAVGTMGSTREGCLEDFTAVKASPL
ncbi:unnamed protein product [Amoebophrya sp. A120]|nr:unnamed protein product [Amoebophrya sp. A120]|eukprot:GSA120T00025037001.1